jgi:hypothetical protein
MVFVGSLIVAFCCVYSFDVCRCNSCSSGFVLVLVLVVFCELGLLRLSCVLQTKGTCLCGTGCHAVAVLVSVFRDSNIFALLVADKMVLVNVVVVLCCSSNILLGDGAYGCGFSL